jgi:hypothetical protein
MADPKLPYTIQLQPPKMAFLEEAAKTHQLPDAGKALRCLIDFAREHPELHAEIFGQIHCVDCG